MFSEPLIDRALLFNCKIRDFVIPKDWGFVIENTALLSWMPYILVDNDAIQGRLRQQKITGKLTPASIFVLGLMEPLLVCWRQWSISFCCF